MLDVDKYYTVISDCRCHSAQLVAVTKTMSLEDIEALIELNQFVLGENKAKQLKERADELSSEITWHFIGHLQRNKVKHVVPYSTLIHSIDSFTLLQEIDKRALYLQKEQQVLLQIHVAEEESKFGIQHAQLERFLMELQNEPLKATKIKGLMGMATNTNNSSTIKKEFKQLRTLFEDLQKNVFNANTFNVLSMGMSNDYKLALEEGSTLIRVGSLLFK